MGVYKKIKSRCVDEGMSSFPRVQREPALRLLILKNKESEAGKVESRRIKLYSTVFYFYIDFVLELELYLKCA